MRRVITRAHLYGGRSEDEPLTEACPSWLGEPWMPLGLAGQSAIAASGP